MTENASIYSWIHQRQAQKIAQMGEGELLIYYVTRRINRVDQANTGPSNLINILIQDRFVGLGIDFSKISQLPEEEIRKIAQDKLNNTL